MQDHVWLKRALILIPVAIGIAVVMLAPKLKTPPEKIKVAEVVTKVRTIKPLHQLVGPRVIGYGTSAPSRSWDAVAEVAGRVVWVSDQLKEGAILPAGMEVLRIDDAEYQFELSRINAQLNASKVKADTTHKSLVLEQASQASLRKEVARKQGLKSKGLATSSSLEAEQRNLIKADVTIQNLKNSLAINLAERQTLKIQLQQTELDLARTTLVTPFDLRVVSIDAYQARFANKGQLLFSADATDQTEIEARFPIGQLRPLIRRKDPSQADQQVGAVGLDAVVRLRTSTHTVQWQAKVERVAGQIDRQTQTSGVIVVVDDPYGKAQPGQRPPLIRNTFVEVELIGKPQGKQIVVPISALHEGKLYVLDEDQRLDIRKVKVAFTQGRYAVLEKGLKPDEKIVVSDLIPAIQGMLLEPVVDKKSRKALMAEVSGTAATNKSAKDQKTPDQQPKGQQEAQ